MSILEIMKRSGENEGLKFQDIPDYADMMPLQEWMDACECGAFIDYDGDGELATETQVSNIIIQPSDRKAMEIPEWATHVAWYNK